MILKRLVALILVTCVYMLSCQGQSSFQCPSYQLVNVSRNDSNLLLFSEFPSDSPPQDVSYNPGALGAWYEISSGIINIVQPGSLTQDVIVPLLDGNNLTNFADNLPSPQQLGQDIAGWWAGIIALTVLGGVLSCSFCFCCGCFVVCRLCGKCGGNLKQEETSSMNCLTIVFTIILIVFVCGLIAGIVLSFFSNQRIFESINEFEDTIDDTFNLAETFVNDTFLKVDTLLCQLNDTLDITVDEARGLLRRVDNVIDSFSGDVYQLVDTTLSLSSALEAVQMSLTNISVAAVMLQTSASNLNSTLQNISQTILAISCPPIITECSSLNDTAAMLQNGVATDYQQLPNITGELQNVQNLLGSINLTQLAQQGNTTFNNALENIMNLTRSSDTEIVSAVDTLRQTVFNTSSTIRTVSDNITGSSGYINSARSIVDGGFNYIRPYDTPRYAVGIIISCSTLIVVFVVFLGLLCGLCGFRTDRAPYERTDLSNCGGVTLLCSAILGFLFGFMMFLLAALVFFSGGVLQKFCSDLSQPEYILINNTVDNPSLNGNQYLLSGFILQNGSIPLTFSEILNLCSNGNTTIFQALKLNQSSYFKDIMNFTNISQIVPNVTGDVRNFARNISNIISRETFVPQDVQDRLDGFDSTGVEGIDISQFTIELNQAIISFDIGMQITQLTNVRDVFFNASMYDISNQTQSIIDQLTQVETDTMNIQSQANAAVNQVSVLSNNTQQLRDGVGILLMNINETFERIIDTGIDPIVQDVETIFPRAIGYGQQLIDHALRALEYEVGNCHPVYAVYTGFYNAACEFTLDGLNGFWLALGMCGIMLIPIIIFSIVTSQYYRRMKYEEDLGVLPYDDSFPLKNTRY